MYASSAASGESDFNLNLYPPVTTVVVCYQHLLISIGSLYCKQCGPRSDCPQGSSLIRVHSGCTLRGSRNFCQGGGVRHDCQKKALTTCFYVVVFFLISPQLMLQFYRGGPMVNQWFISKKQYNFPRFQRGGVRTPNPPSGSEHVLT